jgi:hypothetical protein
MDVIGHMTSGLMVAVEYRCMRSDEIADGQERTRELLYHLATPECSQGFEPNQ